MDLSDFRDDHVGLSKRYCDIGFARTIPLWMSPSCRPLRSNETSGSIDGISILDAEVGNPKHPPVSRAGLDDVRLVEI